MKTHIYYFSGTGNSLNAARLLAGELGDCEIISIPDAIGRELDPSFDRIGVVFPVYGWGVPLIVRDFLKKVRTDKYVFVVATYGGNPGGTIAQAERILRDSGTVLKCGMGLKMPTNCIMITGALPVEKQGMVLDEAGSRIKKIASIIGNGEGRYVERGFLPVNWLLTGVLNGMAAKKLRTGDMSFKVESRCASCGTCVKMCPVDNIEMAGGRPQWQHHCEQCLSCLQWCPREAIQIDHKTQDRKRYRNPAVSMKDIIRR